MKSEGNSPQSKPIRTFKDLFYFIKNLKLNEQLFLKNLEIILGTYDLSDHIVKVSEFKLSQQFLKRLKSVLDSEHELKSSFRNLKLYLQLKQKENRCCLEDLLNFNLNGKSKEDKENKFDFINNKNLILEEENFYLILFPVIFKCLQILILDVQEKKLKQKFND
jgi:hypothetical protein